MILGQNLEIAVVVRRRRATCARCGAEIDAGDRAVRYASIADGFTHGIYCLKCWPAADANCKRKRGKRGRAFGPRTSSGRARCAAARRGR